MELSFTEMGLISDENKEYFSGEITKTGHALINATNQAEIQNIFSELFTILNTERKKRFKKTFDLYIM